MVLHVNKYLNAQCELLLIGGQQWSESFCEDSLKTIGRIHNDVGNIKKNAAIWKKLDYKIVP